MDSGTHNLEALRARLTGLSSLLGGGEPAVAVSVSLPAAAQEPARPTANAGRATVTAGRRAASPPARQQFQAVVRPQQSTVLRSANVHARDAPLGGLLQKYKDAEALWLKEKGQLMTAAKKERARAQKAEAELRRVQEQLAFRVGEVKHLKQALKGRDGELQDLQDRLREYELAEGGERTAQETVRQAEEERDELRGAMQELLQRLGAANDVITQADASMSGMEATLAAAAAGRQQAEEEAGAARAEADALRNALAELQWKCGLLQQLSDLTLKQNEDKSATLRQLLESESMLDAAASGGGSAAAAGGDASL